MADLHTSPETSPSGASSYNSSPSDVDPHRMPVAPVETSLWVSFRTLLRWQLAQLGPMLPLLIVIQALLAAGIIIGFGLIIPDITEESALFLSTGAPSVLVFTMGLVLVPQAVAQSRAAGTFTYMRSLPLPRPLLLVGELLVWSMIALPSVAVAVLVAWPYYDLSLSLDWPVLLASTVLLATTSTAVGYAIAVTLPPMLAQLISQVLVFFVLLFSPVTYPADRLPDWFQWVHDVLPIRPGADLLRAGLASEAFEASARDLMVLLAWCLVGVFVSVRALVRRR